MSKARIYEFDPVIYPRTLWVVKGGTKDDIKAKFLNNEQEEINFGGREDIGAWVCNAVSFLLRSVGIEHTSDTEEAYAYAYENLYFRITSWACS